MEEKADLKIERQKFQLHKKGYEDIVSAIKESSQEDDSIQKISIENIGDIEVIELKGEKGDKGEPGVDGKSPTSDELIDIIKPLIPEPVNGKDGSDYILTEDDKAEIAKTITVPIVEKIIEKTETIVEKPIIQEVENKDTPQDIVDKLRTIKKPWIPIEAIDGDVGRKTIAGVSSIKQLSDVDYSGLEQDGQGNYILGGASQSWDSPYGDATFTYDVDGNVETKMVGLVTLSYTYDVDGNIYEITDGQNIKRFSYDVDGNVETITYL